MLGDGAWRQEVAADLIRVINQAPSPAAVRGARWAFEQIEPLLTPEDRHFVLWELELADEI